MAAPAKSGWSVIVGRLTLIGVACLVLGVGGAAITRASIVTGMSPFIFSMMTPLSLLYFYLALAYKRFGDQYDAHMPSVAAVQRGDLTRARAELDAIREPLRHGGLGRMANENVRAVIAVLEHDGATAVRHATTALAVRRRWTEALFRSNQAAFHAEAHALRAIGRALEGDTAAAVAEANDVLADPNAVAQPLARARLALALAAAKANDRASLKELFADRRWLRPLSIEERRLARKSMRTLYVDTKSLYRQPSDVLERVEAHGLEHAAPAVETKPASLRPEQAESIARDRARLKQEGASRGRKQSGKRIAIGVGIWLALVSLIFANIDRLTRPTIRRADGVVLNVPAATADVAYGGGAGAALGMLVAAGVLLQMRRAVRRVNQAQVAQAKLQLEGEAGTLAVLEKQSQAAGTLGAHAGLLLAGEYDRRSRFAEALAATERALEKIHSNKIHQASAHASISPSLFGERAFLLAERGDPESIAHAKAELGALERDFAGAFSVPGLVYRTHLLIALREGNEGKAAELARARPRGLSLSYDDELLSDALIAVHDPTATREERATLSEEIATDAAVARRMDVIAPNLRSRLAGGAGVRVDPSHESARAIADDEEGEVATEGDPEADTRRRRTD